MQLDRTHIVIRRRSLTEIGDLALVMLRRYPAALLIGFVVGALPWMLINAAVLWWIPFREAEFGLDEEESLIEVWRYLAWMSLLVISQTAVAGIPTTIYLGQAVFESQPTWQSVFAETKRHFWRCTYALSLKRLAIVGVLICLFRIGQPADWFWDMLVPFVLVITIAIVSGHRPFLPEVLVLEQCPLRETASSAITARRRSKALHQPMSAELSGRYLAVSFVLFFLMLSVLYTLVAARGVTIGIWEWDLLFLTILFPLSLWVVAGVSVVVRLLNYLDTRIRLEGWEVELAIRAEAMRQFGEEAGLLPVPAEQRRERPTAATGEIR